MSVEGVTHEFIYTGPDIPPRAGGVADTIEHGRIVQLTGYEAQTWAKSSSRALIRVRLYPDAPYDVMLPGRHLRPHRQEDNA
jgi:hypothetical protein